MVQKLFDEPSLGGLNNKEDLEILDKISGWLQLFFPLACQHIVAWLRLSSTGIGVVW